MCVPGEMKVNEETMIIARHFLKAVQLETFIRVLFTKDFVVTHFLGFPGSSGPSQSRMSESPLRVAPGGRALVAVAGIELVSSESLGFNGVGASPATVSVDSGRDFSFGTGSSDRADMVRSSKEG